MALSFKGPFIYDGLTSVYARYDYGGPPVLVGGSVNIAKLYQRLTEEGLLSRKVYDDWLRNRIVHALPRQVLAARGRNKSVYPLKGMTAIYGHIPAFYFFVWPLYLYLVDYSPPLPGRKKVLHAWRRSRHLSTG